MNPEGDDEHFDSNIHEWAWDESFASYNCRLSEGNLTVNFHPKYSTGTAAIRGNMRMIGGRHYYWEIKMLTAIFGTDVMVGVGTAKADLVNARTTFCSLLGSDRESWGFSYHGQIQHNGIKQNYAVEFQGGNLVGVHLDTWKGTLEFYLNRKPLGVAFTGLRNLELYPMVSSTAGRSGIKLNYCDSVHASLQIDCLARLRPSCKAYLIASIPGLHYLSKSIFALILNRLDEEDENEEDSIDLRQFMALDESDFELIGIGGNRKKYQLMTNLSL